MAELAGSWLLLCGALVLGSCMTSHLHDSLEKMSREKGRIVRKFALQ